MQQKGPLRRALFTLSLQSAAKTLLRLREGVCGLICGLLGPYRHSPGLQAFGLEAAQEGFLMVRVLQRDILRHLALAHGVEQRLVHGLHADGALEAITESIW